MLFRSTGLEMFVDKQVRTDDPRMARVRENFKANLDDILDAGLSAGAKIVLSTVACNLKDHPPFGSMNGTALDANALQRFQALRSKAEGLFQAQQFEAAAAVFQDAVALDSAHAEMHFRLAQCQQALGKSNEAVAEFTRARDLDTLRFRSDSENAVIVREAAKMHQNRGVRFVDAIEKLNRANAAGACGLEEFYEHVHFNFSGNYALARILADEVLEALPAWARQSAGVQSKIGRAHV